MNSYISYEELLDELGYRFHKPKVGNLGKALSKASKNNRSAKWLKEHLDCFYKKLRQDNKRGDQNNAN